MEVQDAAEQFFTQDTPFTPDTAVVGSFVKKVIRMDCINLMNKESRRRELLTENYEEWSHESAPDPLDSLLAEELEDEILGGLSDLEKDIYARVIGNGVTYKEVSRELGMSEEAVRKHVSRIKGKFNGKTNKEK